MNTAPLLSDRQADVLALLLRGLSQKQAAAVLRISPKTVNTHVVEVRYRIGVPLMSFALHYPDQAMRLYRHGAELCGGDHADAS